MKIWTVIYKLNDQDFIHTVANNYSTQRKAIESIRSTSLFKGLNAGGQVDVITELMIEGVVEIDDATFIILETMVDA